MANDIYTTAEWRAYQDALEASTLQRVRLVQDGHLGTILESDRGWVTVLFDGAPTPSDLHTPFVRGILVRIDGQAELEAALAALNEKRAALAKASRVFR